MLPYDVDALTVPAFLLEPQPDGSMRYVAYNEAAARRNGISRDDRIGKTPLEAYEPSRAAEMVARHQLCLSSRSVVDYEEELIHSGGAVWWWTTLLPIERNGKVIGIFGVARDVTDRKRNELALRSAAIHDPLTGLGNRRAFRSDLAAAIGRSNATQEPFGLIVADLVKFKSVNDTYGHEFGDHVLRQAAAAIRRSLRATDSVARIGGDEFVAIVSTTSEFCLSNAMERVRNSVGPTETIDGVEVHISVSVGGTTWRSGLTADAMFREADESMYASKGHLPRRASR